MGKLLPDVHHCCLVTGLPVVHIENCASFFFFSKKGWNMCCVLYDNMLWSHIMAEKRSSIHFCHCLSPSQGCLFPAVSHMWTGCQFITGLWHKASIDILHVRVFGRGEKAEYVRGEKPVHVTGGARITPHLVRIEPATFSLRGRGADHCASLPLLKHMWQLSLIFIGCLIRRSHRRDCCCSYHHPKWGGLMGIRPSHLLTIVGIMAGGVLALSSVAGMECPVQLARVNCCIWSFKPQLLFIEVQSEWWGPDSRASAHVLFPPYLTQGSICCIKIDCTALTRWYFPNYEMCKLNYWTILGNTESIAHPSRPVIAWKRIKAGETDGQRLTVDG